MGSGIPSDIYKDLRRVLLASNLLDTTEQVQTIFADDRISSWRNSVPEATNRTARISGVISHLHRKKNKQGKKALILLLEVLLDWVEMDDETYYKLVDLMTRLGQSVQQSYEERQVRLGREPALIITPQIDMEELAPYAEGVDLLLVIKREGDQLGWGWQGKYVDRGVELNPPETFTEDQAQKFIKAVIDELIAGGLTGTVSETLQSKGGELTDFIPPAVQNALKETVKQSHPPQLLLLTNDIYTPWELAYLSLAEGQPANYLHCQTVMGRWPLTKIERIKPPPTSLTLQQMTVVAGEYSQGYQSKLPQALAEQTILQTSYGATALRANKETVDSLILRERQAGHLLHCIVHGDSDTENTPKIYMEDYDKVVASRLVGEYQVGDTPRFSFIFLNACSVGLPGQSLGQLGGFPGDFLRGGVQGFIAPLWKIHDTTAKLFAEQFYQGTFGGLFNHPIAVGETLYKLRQQYQPGQSVTPLGYIYYGHPSLKLSMPKGGFQSTVTTTGSTVSQPYTAPLRDATSLDGQRDPVNLGGSFTLHAPGLKGKVQELTVEQNATRSTEGTIDEEWLDLLENLGLTPGPVFQMEVSHDDNPYNPAEPATRDDGLTATTRQGEPAMLFEMDRPATDQTAMLLYTDEANIARWVFPSSLSTDERLTFNLPRTITPTESPTEDGDAMRGLFNGLGRRAWRVVIPWVEAPFQKGAYEAAKYIEERWYPYGWLTLKSTGFETISQPDWVSLQEGRALLMIHGTFSNTQSAFGNLSVETIQKLHAHYEGRIIAFNHPTVHQHPRDNVDRLLADIPNHIRLNLDILTHSRGGVVGRELCYRITETNLGQRIKIHKALLVACPNQGSILVNGDKLVDLVDRMTNIGDPIVMPMLFGLGSLFAHGSATGLKGLQSMLPKGEYLNELAKHLPTQTTFYALGASYTPTEVGWKDWLWGKKKEATMDAIFGEENDMVVPTVGSYQAGHNADDFHIRPENRLIITSNHHTNIFEDDKVKQKIVEWLIQKAES